MVVLVIVSVGSTAVSVIACGVTLVPAVIVIFAVFAMTVAAPISGI
ncbi:hypothetical protein [Acetobacter cibinongensis]|nr:hypothetical protein [Acetobacter cibinongensis]